MLNLVIFIEANCSPRRSQCWTWWSLLRPIAVQETLLSWKDFKNYVNEKIFLVAYYYKIVVQKALLSCFLEKISRIMWTKTSFLWHISTRSLFKKHCFLDKIWPRGSQWWRYIVKKYFRESIRCFLKRFQELCERKHLSCGILVQDRCSKSTAFLTRFDQEALNGENTRKHFFR